MACANTQGRWHGELQKFASVVDQWKPPYDSSQYSPYYIEKADILELILGIEQHPSIVKPELTQAEFYANRRKPYSGSVRDSEEVALSSLIELIDGGAARDIYPGHHLLCFNPFSNC